LATSKRSNRSCGEAANHEIVSTAPIDEVVAEILGVVDA
jgi:hypothetical protein